jgi:hypothetical protein
VKALDCLLLVLDIVLKVTEAAVKSAVLLKPHAGGHPRCDLIGDAAMPKSSVVESRPVIWQLSGVLTSEHVSGCSCVGVSDISFEVLRFKNVDSLSSRPQERQRKERCYDTKEIPEKKFDQGKRDIENDQFTIEFLALVYKSSKKGLRTSINVHVLIK